MPKRFAPLRHPRARAELGFVVVQLDGMGMNGGLPARGGFYKVGVADRGGHGNRMDKIRSNEQWVGWPVGSHDAERSNVTDA